MKKTFNILFVAAVIILAATLVAGKPNLIACIFVTFTAIYKMGLFPVFGKLFKNKYKFL